MPSPRSQHEMLAQLIQEVNEPLTAIRNAVYLAATCQDGTKCLDLLRLADAEVSRIVRLLTLARAEADALACAAADAQRATA